LAREGYVPSSLEDVKRFLEELTGISGVVDWFEWVQSKNLVTARFKKYLGDRQKFARIASAFRDMGGEYVSAGKDSHFRIYLQTPSKPIRPIEAILNDMELLVKELREALQRG